MNEKEFLKEIESLKKILHEKNLEINKINFISHENLIRQNRKLNFSSNIIEYQFFTKNPCPFKKIEKNNIKNINMNEIFKNTFKLINNYEESCNYENLSNSLNTIKLGLKELETEVIIV